MVEDFAGNTMFPMYCVKIVNNKGESIRDFDYLAKNKYALSASMETRMCFNAFSSVYACAGDR